MREKKHHLENETINSAYRYLIIGFSIAAILLLTVILYFTFARATVYISPNYQYQKVGFVVQVADENSEQALAQDRLGGKLLETTINLSKTFTGEAKTVNADRASGKVIIYNKNNQAQVLVATTRLLTADNKLYRITDRVTIPAGSKAEVMAKADQPGDEFIIEPTKLTIPGLWEGLQTKIYAENPDGFKKEGVTVYGINSETIKAAAAELEKSAIEQAKKELTARSGQEIPDEAFLIKVLKLENDAKPGTDQKEFKASISLSAKALVFNQQEMKNLAAKSLPASYKNENTLASIETDTLSYTITPLDKNPENLIGQVKGEYMVKLANIKVTALELAGMSRSAALKYIKSSTAVKDVSILMPFWSRSLPVLGDKINIQIEK
ncbi:MAG: hypothetical protein WCW26_05615 [Candidatus Buchananbacteria bacterium]